MGFHFTILDIVINTIFLLITISLAFLNFKYLIKKNYPLKKAIRDRNDTKKSIIFFVIFMVIINLIFLPFIGIMDISTHVHTLQTLIFLLSLYFCFDRYIKLVESKTE